MVSAPGTGGQWGQNGSAEGPVPFRVVVFGESRSGKSTLLNALMRARALPDMLGARHRPDVVLRGARASGSGLLCEADGAIIGLDKPAAWADDLRKARHILLSSDQPHLRGVEQIEWSFPRGGPGPEQFAALRRADAVIWMTIASQAWRLTESQMFDALGWDRPDRALLVLSRADKLRPGPDSQRITDRLRHETGDRFGGTLLLGAGRQMLEQSASSDEAWRQTGGPQIAARIAAWRGTDQGPQAFLPDAEPATDLRVPAVRYLRLAGGAEPHAPLPVRDARGPVFRSVRGKGPALHIIAAGGAGAR